MKALVAGLVLAVVCLAGAVGYLTWDRVAGEDTSSQPTLVDCLVVLAESMRGTDVPRYTEEEVISKVLAYPSKRFGGTIGAAPEWLLYPSGTSATTYCAKYEGNHKWVVAVNTRPVTDPCADPEFSFRENTGEVLPLNDFGRKLMGLME